MTSALNAMLVSVAPVASAVTITATALTDISNAAAGKGDLILPVDAERGKWATIVHPVADSITVLARVGP